MSNADKRHKHSLLVEKSPHRVAKMLVSGLFLNTYNFKLPRVKISLAPTSLEEKKKKRQWDPYVTGVFFCSPPTTSALLCK